MLLSDLRTDSDASSKVQSLSSSEILSLVTEAHGVVLCDACGSEHTCADCERGLDLDECNKKVMATHSKDF